MSQKAANAISEIQIYELLEIMLRNELIRLAS